MPVLKYIYNLGRNENKWKGHGGEDHTPWVSLKKRSFLALKTIRVYKR